MHFPGTFTITTGISLSSGCIFHAHSHLTVVCLRQEESSCFHKTPPVFWFFTFLSTMILFYSNWFFYGHPSAICPHSIQSSRFCLSRWLPMIPWTTKRLTVSTLFYCSFLSNFLLWVPDWNICAFGGPWAHLWLKKNPQNYHNPSWNLYLSL